MNVSTYENGKLVSPYLGIDSILDGVKKTNELNNRAYGLLVCLAVCDTLFTDKTKKNLDDEFEGVIMECNSPEDFAKVSEMLSKAALEGGYATIYYDAVKNNINEDYKRVIKEKNSSALVGMRGPISFIDEKGKLSSPYFDVTFRPTGYKNFKLDMACSGFVMTLSVADLKRDEESQIRLLGDFCDILLSAGNAEEHVMIKVFLDELRKKGGYAIEFNEQVRGIIGFDNLASVKTIKTTVESQLVKYNKDEVVVEAKNETVAETEETKVVIPTIQINSDIDGNDISPTESLDVDVTPSVQAAPVTSTTNPLVEDFKDSYNNFLTRLNAGGDFSILLRNARRLQEQLLDCMNVMDRAEFDKYDQELENKVKELRSKI